MRSTLQICLLSVLISLAAAHAACGDCNRDGQVSVLDALAAAQHDLGLIQVPFLHLWRCDVTGSGTVDILDALLLAQSVAGLPVSLGCPANPVGYALYMTTSLELDEPLFVDSFDSAAGPYSPSLPVGSPFATPWQGSSGAVGSGGVLTLTSPMNEFHGPLHFGTTSSVAGLLAIPPAQRAPASLPRVSAAEWDWAENNNDNDEINASAILDPFYYPPGSQAYIPSVQDLVAWGPGTCVSLGDPGGQHRTYYLNAVHAAVGGIVEFAGPVTLYLGPGYFLGDAYDGVANFYSALPSTEVTILGRGTGAIELDFEPGFAGTIYSPDNTYLYVANAVDFIGSIVCARADFDSVLVTAPIAIHYDEALR